MSSEARQSAEDRYYQAIDLFGEGRVEESIGQFKAALELDPTFTDALHGLARAFQEAQRFDEAIEVAQRIAAIDPEDVLAHTSLSILYQRKGMVPEAEAEALKAKVLGWKQELKGK